MKDMFNRRQRFSLRKYSFGVCSVLLGTALFLAGAQTVSADENETSTDAVSANAVVPTTADTSTGNTEAPTAYAADAALPTSGGSSVENPSEQGNSEAGSANRSASDSETPRVRSRRDSRSFKRTDCIYRSW